MTKRWQSFRCVCEFAKFVGETSPCVFPRVGISDNVLLRGCWIIRHEPTGQEATIIGHGYPEYKSFPPEAMACCALYFAEHGHEIPDDFHDKDRM